MNFWRENQGKSEKNGEIIWGKFWAVSGGGLLPQTQKKNLATNKKKKTPLGRLESETK